MEILSLIVNIFMAGLLFVTILYCWRLNQRVQLLQDSRSELARIIREFDESTQRATKSIAEIHQATQRLSDNIQHKIDKANFIANDLKYMIEKGSKLTGKPVETVSRMAVPSRDIPPSGSALVSPRSALEKAHNVDIIEGGAPATSRHPPVRSRSRAEQELLSILKGNKG